MANGYFDTKGLFGTTPEELQRKIFDESQLRRAKEMQFLASGTTAPGYTYGMLQTLEPLRQQFANTGEDPRVTQLRQRAIQAQKAFEGFDTKDPQSMRNTATKLYQMGMPEQAVKLLNAAKSLESGAPADVQNIKFWESRLECNSLGGEEKKQCQEKAAAIVQERRRDTPENLFFKEYMKKLGIGTAEEDVKIKNAALAAPNAIVTIDIVDSELDAGNVNTGIFAPIKQNLDRIISSVAGSKSKAAARVQSTQFVESLLGQDIFKQIQALGVGARGLDTVKEREFMQQVITGAITLDAPTLKKMNAIRRNILIRAMKKYNAKFENPAASFKKLIEVEGLAPLDMSAYEETDIDTLTVGQSQAPISGAGAAKATPTTPPNATPLMPTYEEKGFKVLD